MLHHQDLSYTVKWIKGKNNPADYFSQNADSIDNKPFEEQQEASEYEKLTFLVLNNDFTNALGEQDIKQEYDFDKELIQLRMAINNGYLDPNNEL